MPVALKKTLREKLNSLNEDGGTPRTPWSSTNGELRLCIDTKDLNEGIQHEHYRLPTKLDITVR